MPLLTWLISNHPSYGSMELPSTCPQPIFIGGFDQDVSNTDTIRDGDLGTENAIEGEEILFAN